MYKKQILWLGLLVQLTPVYLCGMNLGTHKDCSAHESSDDDIKKLKESDARLMEALWEKFISEGEITGHKDETIYCLGGEQYTFIERLGSGSEAEVYKIRDLHGKEFALKVYYNPAAPGLQAERLVMSKAKKSREFINVPIEVNITNKKYRYSISPFLESSVSKNDMNKLIEFDKKVNDALMQDELQLGDNLNVGNYRYDKNGRLWRIDLGGLRELND